MKNLSIYVHIPFCFKKKCNYCHFISFCDKEDKKQDYINALCNEIRLRGKEYGSKYLIQSIYIGGGTPSLLDIGEMTQIILGIKTYFKVMPSAEITVECNPESITREKLEEYRLIGVNRISIGGQAFKDSTLKLIGRQHDVKTLKSAIKMVKDAGFYNINVDMMIGLPGQTLKDVRRFAKYLVHQNIPHVSSYSLILEKGTPMYSMVKSKKVTLPSEDETVEMYNEVYDILTKAGLKRYEVSNFAKVDYECKHNLNYWRLGEYLGFGVASHSYINFMRFNNTENFEKYMLALSCDTLAVGKVEKLSLKERREETIMLNLRTSEGINLTKFKKDFGENLLKTKKKDIDFLSSFGLIVIKGDHLCVAEHAFYVLGEIVLRLV